MKRKIYLTIILVILSISFSAHAQVTVIANNSVPEGSLSPSAVRDVFMLKKTTWSNNTGIVVFDLKPASDVKTKFYSGIGSTAKKLKKAWMRKMLSGEGQAPEALASEDEILQKVASTPGAIGYVSKAKVSGDVKVLLEIK